MVDGVKADAATTQFNLNKVTAREMGAFWKATNSADIEGVAVGLSKMVTACPYVADGADLSNPDTYMDLPYFVAFKLIVDELAAFAKKTVKT